MPKRSKCLNAKQQSEIKSKSFGRGFRFLPIHSRFGAPASRILASWRLSSFPVLEYTPLSFLYPTDTLDPSMNIPPKLLLWR